MIYPFKWPHPCVPVVPEVFMTILESPWPFLAGVHSRFRQGILNMVREERFPPVVVDLDRSSVLISDAVKLPEFPGRRWWRGISCLLAGRSSFTLTILILCPESAWEYFEDQFYKIPLHYDFDCDGRADLGSMYTEDDMATFDFR